MNAMGTWWRAASALVVAALLIGAGCKKDEKSAPSKPGEGATKEVKIDDAVDAVKDTAKKAEGAVDSAAASVTDAVKDTAKKAEGALDSATASVADAAKDAKSDMAKESKAEVVAILARADVLDGAEDKVITKCAACKLAMDGNDQNTIPVEGYTMYFCTPKCREKFEKEPVVAVLAMEFPEEGEAE